MVIADGEGARVKLLDFGLSLSQTRQSGNSGDLSGTLAYMAPERFLGQAAAEASDLFSFGVIAYELLSGRHPFAGWNSADDGDLITSLLTREPDLTLLPSEPSLRALLRRLLSKSPAGRLSADDTLQGLCQAMALPPPQESTALRESRLQAARLVGRDAPLATLRRALTAAQGGAGSAILLSGESGVGKSRLMEELRVHGLVQGLRCVRGQAKSEASEAYGVFRDILRPLCLATPLTAFEESVLSGILPDLPSLLEHAIPPAPELSPKATRQRIVQVVEALILRQSQPLMLLLEDIHWIDAESLDLLRRLAGPCEGRPILLVASYRDDERPTLPSELPDCALLRLGRLSGDSVRELCQSMLGADGWTTELVDFLLSQTEGNAFFLIEVMRALAEEAGQLSRVAALRLPKNILTGGITAVVQRRLARLPAEARPFLQLAAVAGRTLDHKLLSRLEPQLSTWLYLAADAAVLEVFDQSWRFSHDKIRETLLAELSPTQKTGLHLRIATAMAAVYPGSAEHAAALADHYERGAVPSESARYLAIAGERALQQGAPTQAANLLGQALDARHRSYLPVVQRAQAYNGLAKAQLALGQVQQCQATYEQLEQDLYSDRAAQVLRLASAARTLWRGGEQPSHRFSAEEQHVLREVADAIRWVTESHLWSGHFLQASRLSLSGLLLATLQGDRGLTAYFISVGSFIAGLVPLPALSSAWDGKRQALLAADPGASLASNLSRLASVTCMNRADWPEAERLLRQGIAVARQAGDDNLLQFFLGQLTILLFRLGRLSEFDVVGNELAEGTSRSQNALMARTYPLYRGLLLLRDGDAERAWELFGTAEQHVSVTQDYIGQLLVSGLLALCQLRRGRPAYAVQRAKQALALALTFRYPSEVVGEGIAAIVEVLLETWSSEHALPDRQHTRALLQALLCLQRCAHVFPSSAPRAWLLHARFAWQLGSRAIALRLARVSLQQAEKLAMPYDGKLARDWLQRFTTGEGAGQPILTSPSRPTF